MMQGRKQQMDDFKVLVWKINLEVYSLGKYLWKLRQNQNLLRCTKAERTDRLGDKHYKK